MGCIALRQTKATLPGVSFPSRVVRSIIEIASLRPESFADVLMLRLANAAARSSTMTWSIFRFIRPTAAAPLRLSARTTVCMLEDNACIGSVSMGRSRGGGQLNNCVNALGDSELVIRRAGREDAPIIAYHRARMFQEMGEISDQAFEVFRLASLEWTERILAAGEYVGWFATPTAR